MNQSKTDRTLIIIVAIIGIILLVDIINVFIIGGPSVLTLISRQGSPAFANETPAPVEKTGIPAKMVASSPVSASDAIFVPTKATPVPTVKYVSVVTPIVTSENARSSSPNILPTTQPPKEENYVLIYAEDLSYVSGKVPTAVSFDVKNPPLVINYNISPVMVFDSRYATNSSALKELRTDILINSTYPSPDAVFTVSVFDKTTGGKVAEDGYGRLYGITPKKTFVIREAGRYIIQFYGDDVDAHVEMLLKREGNIE